MKKVIVGMILLITIQHVHCFYLTSPQAKKNVLVSREVVDSIALFKDQVAYNIPGATDDNLTHLRECLIHRYQIIQDTKKDPLLDKSKLDKDPKEEWKKYSTETMNEPQLIALTKTVTSIFSQSIPDHIIDSWSLIIETREHDAGTFLGFFHEPGQMVQGSLGQKIYDACAQRKGSPIIKVLTNSSIEQAPDSHKKSDLEPVFLTREQIKQQKKIDLNSEDEDSGISSNDDNKSSRWERFAKIKSAISQRWAQMDRGEKVAWIAIPAAVFFLWYKLSHRG